MNSSKMFEKKIQKILDAVLKRIAIEMNKEYGIDEDNVYNLINNIPDDLRCIYIFKQGKKKGKVCNEIACQSHLEQIEDSQKAVFDEDITEVLNNSIMYDNVNKTRLELGLPPLTI